MQRIIAFIMSVIMLIGSLLPALPGSQINGVKTGDWLTMVVEEFNMEDEEYSATPHYATITSSNPYFKIV
ncbi:MAG: hypothetical protein GXZ02_06140, partial [Clostridiales bacterium]|nr:hypothetical protein [Clostridiales bacterium]